MHPLGSLIAATIPGTESVAHKSQSLKPTSLFGLIKSKPDLETASMQFDKAATTFKQAKLYEDAIAAHVKAAECQEKLGVFFAAAKSLESAAGVLALQLKRPEDAADMYKRVSDMLVLNGSADKAAEMLEKAAKTVEATNQIRAIELYLASCDILEDADRGRLAVDTFKRTATMLLKAKRYDLATATLSRLAIIYRSVGNKNQVQKTALCTIILQLALNDEVAASKEIRNYAADGFPDSDEGAAAQELLQAWREQDEKRWTKVVNAPIVTFLDNEVTRLARSLRVPGASSVVSNSGYTQTNHESIKHGSHQEEDEDLGIL
ncbi:hypothetical protein HDU93_007887 [Gonapodya sp. JEL0774]|nr:hypothetical protein HDU93_007887 [Gonapodya sp. JEL0774]